MFSRLNERLVLRYERGQNTFSNFLPSATDEQLYQYGHILNAFQDTEIKQVQRVQNYEFIF